MVRLPSELVERVRPGIAGRSVVVTGGAGFIGGHIVDALVSIGASVTVIDDLSNSNAEHLGRLIDLEPDRIGFVHGSILDDGALRDAFADARDAIVFHLAAIGSVPRSIEDPQRTMDVNDAGTVRVLERARRAGASRVVLSSSSSVYGEAAHAGSNGANGASGVDAKSESQRPDPISPYGASKIAAEHAMTSWARSFEIDTVSLRYFNVFGPRQPADSAYAAVIPAFIDAALHDRPLVVYGDGEQTRDFTFVGNVVAANLLAGAREAPLGGEALNVGTGRSVSVNELARRIGEAAGSEVRIEHRDERAGDIRHSVADVRRVGERLGHSLVTELDEGLSITVDWAREALAGAG